MSSIFIYRKGALGDTLSFMPFLFYLQKQYDNVIFACNYLFREIFEGINFIRFVDADSYPVRKVLRGETGVLDGVEITNYIIFSDVQCDNSEKFRSYPALPVDEWFYLHPFKSVGIPYTPEKIVLPIYFDPALFGVIKNKNYFVFHPGSGGKNKVWSLQNFFKVEEALNKKGVNVVYLLGESEHDYAHALKERRHYINLPFKSLVFLLVCSSGYLGCDSGITHLAGLLNIRGWALFGPSSPSLYRPWGDISVIQGYLKNMESISTGMVIRTIYASFETTRD